MGNIYFISTLLGFNKMKMVFTIIWLIPVVLGCFMFIWSEITTYPSKIIDFKPQLFSEKAANKFFYSIGNELKYSDSIDSSKKSIFKGELKNIMISPDNKKALIVSNEKLLVIDSSGSLKDEIVEVNSIYKKPKSIGESFFRNDHFQWAKSSESVYLIKDEYYNLKGSQLFSNKGALYKYVLKSKELTHLISPFKAYKYFIVNDEDIYFSIPNKVGNLVLKYFDGTKVYDAQTISEKMIEINGLGRKIVKEPFHTFTIFDYKSKVLPMKGVKIVTILEGKKRSFLEINDSNLLEVVHGQGLKGPYAGLELLRSFFLPGDEYFLLNINTGTYEGQLLFEINSGCYKTLPKDTRVYLNINTNIYDNKITDSGVVIKSPTNR